MMNGANDGLALDDDDRLPWLEPAYDEDGDNDVSFLRLGTFILAGLALIGLLVGGIYLIRNHFDSHGEAELIRAQQGSYKIPAADADAKKFQGEGDASFATSEGIERGGRIDPSRLPEAPMVSGASVKSAPADEKTTASAATKTVETKVADHTGEKGRIASAPGSSLASGGAIQLGAYGNEALARDAWGRFSKRFDYLASLSYNIEPVTVGGTRFYRLRAHAGKDAAMLCGKLKVAGESCLVVN